uniref:Putative secreted protein n=1 Tax=Anopheles marajoara TaxID=58244 RepID=A0A2M4C7Q9_9DIPT
MPVAWLCLLCTVRCVDYISIGRVRKVVHGKSRQSTVDSERVVEIRVDLFTAFLLVACRLLLSAVPPPPKSSKSVKAVPVTSFLGRCDRFATTHRRDRISHSPRVTNSKGHWH